MSKQYLDYTGLSRYDSNIKDWVDDVVEDSVLPLIPSVGSISSGNTGYVTGGDVYTALSNIGPSNSHDVELSITVTASQELTFRGVATTVDWGDGISNTGTRGTTHTYISAGNYKVLIDGITEWGDSSQSSSGATRSILGNNVITSAVINTEEIGTWAFRNCTSLITVKVPDVHILRKGAFYGCTGLSALKAKIHTLEDYALYNCSSLTHDINESVYDLRKVGCYSLVGTGFSGILDLSKLVGTKPASQLSQLGISCQNLKGIILPKTLNNFSIDGELPLHKFEGFEIPNNIIQLDGLRGLETSKNITNGILKRIVIPSNVQYLGTNVFRYCGTIKEIYMEDGAFSQDTVYLPNSSGDFTTSDTSISSFYDATSFCSECVSLTKVRLPNGMKMLGPGNSGSTYLYSWFYKSPLTELELPESLKSIYNICQENTSLTTITIPKNVETIGASCFKNASLQTIIMKPITPPTLDANSFRGCPAVSTVGGIVVPYSSDHSILAAYQEATNWSDWATYMVEEPQS